MKLLIIAILCISIYFPFNCGQKRRTYTAAVFEHRTFYVPAPWTPTKEEALEVMKINLQVFKDQARLASSRGAQIIVFPEDGLYGFGYTRQRIVPFLDEIPDPKTLKRSWNPCREPYRYKDTEVLRTLSCIARNNSIAVVANMGDIQPCFVKTDPQCPSDHHYQFNTDVILDTDGTFLAKYHKQNLFREPAFDTPPKCEYVTFVTSFGVNFGVFTCFDILFEKPAMDLVMKFGVRNFVVPTAWWKGFPILFSVQSQQAWSRVTCGNLLAANQHHPMFSMWGSGIYSCGQPKAYIFNPSASVNERLLIATLEDLDVVDTGCRHNGNQLQPRFKNGTDISAESFIPFSGPNQPGARIFHAKLMDDVYDLVKLPSTSTGTTLVCQHELCCGLQYEIKGTFGSEFYALAAFKGRHNKEGYYLEVCALVKCASTEEQSCGIPVETASTLFQSLRLSGNFSSTAVVFPELLGSGNRLFDVDAMATSGHSVMESQGLTRPLLSAVLLGRDYSKDPTSIPGSSG